MRIITREIIDFVVVCCILICQFDFSWGKTEKRNYKKKEMWKGAKPAGGVACAFVGFAVRFASRGMSITPRNR